MDAAGLVGRGGESKVKKGATFANLSDKIDKLLSKFAGDEQNIAKF